MPVLNPPAFDAGTRISPIDGKNLNRIFPGKARGTDLTPSIMFHKIRNPGRMARTIAIMKAFWVPAETLIKECGREGMLDTKKVERMGKIFGCCEPGGLGRVTPVTVALTWTGMTNVMTYLGV